MNDVFLDTSAFYALADSGDLNHPRARAYLKVLSRSGGGLLTSTDVLDETITMVRFHLGHVAAVKIGEKLMASTWCRVIEVQQDTRDAAWALFVRYADQRFSFTDCTSFALMRAMRLSEAFTFDRRDFSAAGLIPRPD